MPFSPPAETDVETDSTTGFVPPAPNEVETKVNAFVPPKSNEIETAVPSKPNMLNRALTAISNRLPDLTLKKAQGIVGPGDVGFVPPKLTPPETTGPAMDTAQNYQLNPLPDISRGSAYLGNRLRDIAGAYAFEAIGDPEEQAKQLGISDAALQKAGLLTTPSVPGTTPLEQGQAALPLPLQIESKAVTGTIQSSPKLAATLLSGPAAPLVGAALFGYDDEGNFHPAQAAVAGALPFVGKIVGPLAEGVAGKLGVSNEQALTLINQGSRYAAANTVLAAQALPGWSNMTREQKIDAVSGIMANGFLGLGDFFESKGVPEKADEILGPKQPETPLAAKADAIAPVAPLTAEALKQTGQTEISGQTQKAAAGVRQAATGISQTATELGQTAAETAAAPHEAISEASKKIGIEAKQRIESGRIAEPGYWLSEMLKKLSPDQIEILRVQPEQVLEVLHQFRERVTAENFEQVVNKVREHYGLDAPAEAPPAEFYRGRPLVIFGQSIQTQPKDKNASDISKTTEVHGNVQPQPVGGVRQVPIEEGVGGVQSQTEGGLPQEVQPTQPHTGTPQEVTPTKLVQAAVKTPDGQVHTGPNHPEILNRLGITGFESRESRNTPMFGFVDEQGNFHTRPEAAEIAKQTGQQLEPFDVDEQGIEQPHSDEVKLTEQPKNPGGALSSLSPELQAKSNAVKDAMKGQLEQLRAQAAQKYRVGNNPTPHTLVETLEQSPTEKANGEQPVRVRNDKTGQESTVLQSDLTPIKTLTAAEKTAKAPKTDLDQQLRDAGLDPTVFKTMAEKKAALKRQEALSVGPGAQSIVGDPTEGSELGQLTKSISDSIPRDAPLTEALPVVDRIKAKASDIKDAALNTLAKAKAVGDAIWDKYSGVAEWNDEKQAVGEWTYANQKADHEARQFAKAVTKAVPNRVTREAMTNWIQADGDEAVLRQRADASKGTLKQGYEAALKLSDYEKTLARNIGQYFESQLQKGTEAGILGSSIDDYVNQVWKRESPFTRSLKNDFSSGKLQPNFQFAKRRIYDSYFQGEQAGETPANKDVGALISLYDQNFNKALSARAFLKDMHEGVASDGRPLVEVSGSGMPLQGDEAMPQIGKPDTLLIRPKSKSPELSDYKPINHPAMRGWKWVQTMPDGTQVMLQGDLLVHPEAYTKLKNRLATSLWRQNPVGRAILGTQTAVKQSMLSLSGFHQVQEALHAMGHRVNPLNLDHVDFDEPVQKELITHGLQVADYRAMEAFGEGLASGPIINRIPIIGKRLLQPYTEWLFQDYIPRLKVTMAKEALERNVSRYGDKLSRDQILEMTASQANHAFGELNLKFMGRNPSVQDSLRAFLLAPDFLEARAGFVGQALRPHGREQLVALGLLAATQYISARLINKAIDDDYHFEPKHAFSYIYNGHEYSLRTVPGDIMHLITDPRSFFYNRLSMISRTAMEAISGRDSRGVKRDAMEQVKDMAKTPMPLSLHKRDDQRLWETFLNSVGFREQKFSPMTEISQDARKFRDANKPKGAFEEIYDAEKDQYRPLRVALENQDLKAAQTAYDSLKKTVEPSKINQNMRRYYTKPFTGSNALENKFQKQLDEHGKERYKDARTEQRQNLDMFSRVKK